MRHRSVLQVCGALLGLLACGDDGVGPDTGTDASRAAARFEQLADSVEGEGYSPAVGSCTADHATFDWAQFSCEAARLRFGFSMRVEPVRYEPLMGRASLGDPEGTHQVSMAASDVDGVRLTIEAWTPPPLPPPTEPPPGPPVPIDSTLVEPPR